MTVEEQIAEAKEYNLTAKSKDEFKSEIIKSLEYKFEFGSFKENGIKLMRHWAAKKMQYEVEVNGKDREVAHKIGKEFAIDMFKQHKKIMKDVKSVMVWTICDNNIEDLVSECIDKILNDYSKKILLYSFDAQVCDVATFRSLVSKLSNYTDGSVLVIKNCTLAQRELFSLLRAYIKDNDKDNFYIVASSPLDLPNGIKDKWEPYIGIPQSVLLSE